MAITYPLLVQLALAFYTNSGNRWFISAKLIGVTVGVVTDVGFVCWLMKWFKSKLESTFLQYLILAQCLLWVPFLLKIAPWVFADTVVSTLLLQIAYSFGALGWGLLCYSLNADEFNTPKPRINPRAA